MSEPAGVATRVDTLVPGVLHWSVQDERIGFRSEAYALPTPEGAVLIDPLPLSEEALQHLGPLRAICLTAAFHERSAWRYRAQFHVPVFAPRGAVNLEGVPDIWYGQDEILPGGLRPIPTQGPFDPHYLFLLESQAGGGVLFSGDLVLRGDGGLFVFHNRWQTAPELMRESARRLLHLPVETLCPAHGAPAVTGAILALRHAMDREAQR